MKKQNLIYFLAISLFFMACEPQKPVEEKTVKPETESVEDLPKIMTPEVLWKLKRLSDAQVSPDGSTVLFGLTTYDVSENKGNRDLYIISVEGGEPKQITDLVGSEFNALWYPDGEKIGFLSAKDGSVQLYEINADGSGLRQVTHLEEELTGFEWSNDGKQIIFTVDVKLDKTAKSG